MAKLTVTITADDSGSEREIPGKYEVCPTCDGHGDVDTFGAFTPSQADEWGWEQEDWDDYKQGNFGRGLCPKCRGKGMIVVADVHRCSPKDYDQWLREQQEIAECNVIEAAERRVKEEIEF